MVLYPMAPSSSINPMYIRYTAKIMRIKGIVKPKMVLLIMDSPKRTSKKPQKNPLDMRKLLEKTGRASRSLGEGWGE